MAYDISKKSKDIIQKYVAGAFKDTSLKFYGINVPKIKELINVEFPIIEVNDNSSDFVFLLEDNTYLHLEFQTVYSKDDLIRFMFYDLRLYKRDKRKIYTVIVYASNVKNIETPDIGTLIFNPDIISLKDYDGDSIYKDIENKILNGQDIADLDILNLLFLPLMKNKKHKSTVAVNSIKLAKNIKDREKRNICIASIFAFSSKYLNNKEINKIMEVIKMTDLGAMLIKEGFEDGVKNGFEDGFKNGKSEKAIEIAKNLLKLNMSIDVIIEATGIDEKTIKKLQQEIK